MRCRQSKRTAAGLPTLLRGLLSAMASTPPGRSSRRHSLTCGQMGWGEAGKRVQLAQCRSQQGDGTHVAKGSRRASWVPGALLLLSCSPPLLPWSDRAH